MYSNAVLLVSNFRVSFDLSNAGGCGFHNRHQVGATRAVYLNKRLGRGFLNLPLFRPLPAHDSLTPVRDVSAFTGGNYP
jgi:hypothetical protein